MRILLLLALFAFALIAWLVMWHRAYSLGEEVERLKVALDHAHIHRDAHGRFVHTAYDDEL